jgi:hypothetical protein
VICVGKGGVVDFLPWEADKGHYVGTWFWVVKVALAKLFCHEGLIGGTM